MGIDLHPQEEVVGFRFGAGRLPVLPALLLAVLGCSSEEAPEGVNVLLLVSDDQGTVLGCYGASDIRTPRLDQLATESVRFENAYATSAVCTPSRSALYTGRWGVSSGVTGFNEVRADVPVWGELLSDAGYHTGLIGKLGAKPIARFPFDFRARTSPGDAEGRSVLWHVERMTEFLDGAGEEPWCLLVNFRDSHFPFPIDGAPTGWPGADDRAHDPQAVRVPVGMVDEPGTRAEIARYYDGLRRMDTTVGAMLDLLEEQGASGNTLVLFTSDNGPPTPFAKTTLYEAGIRMPLLARLPGRIEPGRVEERFVTLLDVLPTVLEVAPQSIDGPPWDGRSLWPLLDGGDAPWREAVFAEHTLHRVDPPTPARSIRLGRYKYIRNLAHEVTFENAVMQTSAGWRAMALSSDPEVQARVQLFRRRPQEELYDLEADPHELVSLAEDPKHEAARQELATRLREHLAEIGDPYLEAW